MEVPQNLSWCEANLNVRYHKGDGGFNEWKHTAWC